MRRRIVVLLAIPLATAATLPARPAAPSRPDSACAPSGNQTAELYRRSYATRVSLAGAREDRERARLGLPQADPSEVRIVTDSGVCRAAVAAFGREIGDSTSALEVIVLQIRDVRVVLSEGVTSAGGHRRPNVVFDADFSRVLGRIWL